MITLLPTHEVRVGDRVIPETYDEHVGLDGYSEDYAEEVTEVRPFDRYSITLVTAGEAATFDRDDVQMVVRWQPEAGRDTTDLEN